MDLQRDDPVRMDCAVEITQVHKHLWEAGETLGGICIYINDKTHTKKHICMKLNLSQLGHIAVHTHIWYQWTIRRW